MMNKYYFRCSNCGKIKEEGTKIIAFTKDGGHICEECVIKRDELHKNLQRSRMLMMIEKKLFYTI
ncbi:MAG: ClpX C4-type zinc finger protein [Planctomycetota bacterium]